MALLPNLPVLEADETLYSWCAHVDAINDAHDAPSTSRLLFGAPYAALCHDFTSRLGFLTAHYPQAGLDGVKLALHHTLLGYFLVLQPLSTAKHLLASVINGSLPSIKMRLGITASRVGGHHPLKGCDACVQEDTHRMGFAYWHVEHQFPSAMACARHGRPLFIAWDPVTPVHRRRWLLPVGGLEWKRIEIPVHDDRQLQQLRRLTDFSWKFASCAPATFDAYRLARCYQRGLRDHGFVTVGGSLRLKTLVNELRGRYSGLEDVVGFEALKSVTPDWPGMVGAVARASPRRVHPLKHLLMIALVYDTWADFLQSYECVDSGVNAGPAKLDPKPMSSDLAEDLVHLIKTDGLSVSAAAHVLGIAVTTATQMAKRANVAFTPRPKVMKGARLKRVEQLLRRGWSSCHVSEATGASVVSINRWLAADADLKQAWQISALLNRRKIARKAFLLAARRCHEATLKELRRTRGSDYMWLYRHDREWLRATIPALWKSAPRCEHSKPLASLRTLAKLPNCMP